MGNEFDRSKTRDAKDNKDVKLINDMAYVERNVRPVNNGDIECSDSKSAPDPQGLSSVLNLQGSGSTDTKIPVDIYNLTLEQLYYKTHSEVVVKIIQNDPGKYSRPLHIDWLGRIFDKLLFAGVKYNIRENYFDCWNQEDDIRYKLIPGLYSFFFYITSEDVPTISDAYNIDYKPYASNNIIDLSESSSTDLSRHLLSPESVINTFTYAGLPLYDPFQPFQLLKETLKRWSEKYKNLFGGIISDYCKLLDKDIVEYAILPFIFPSIEDILTERNIAILNKGW